MSESKEPDLVAIREQLERVMSPEFAQYLMTEIPKGEALFKQCKQESREYRAVLGPLSRMYINMNNQLGLVCREMGYSLNQNDWPDSEPLTVLAKLYPDMQATNWYQNQLMAMLQPITEHPWFKLTDFFIQQSPEARQAEVTVIRNLGFTILHETIRTNPVLSPSLLLTAIRIALGAHHGQLDKCGKDYILHPLRVMGRMQSEDEMIVAVLHDVVEDSDWTIGQLRGAGYSEDVLEAIDCLTRRNNESYEEFITRLSDNPLAVRVKIADMEDNMNILRLETLTPKDNERLNKYLAAWRQLKAI